MNDSEEFTCYIERGIPTYESQYTRKNKEVVGVFKKASKISFYGNFCSVPASMFHFYLAHESNSQAGVYFYFVTGMVCMGISIWNTYNWISYSKKAKDLERSAYEIENLERKIFEIEEKQRNHD